MQRMRALSLDSGVRYISTYHSFHLMYIYVEPNNTFVSFVLFVMVICAPEHTVTIKPAARMNLPADETWGNQSRSTILRLC